MRTTLKDQVRYLRRELDFLVEEAEKLEEWAKKSKPSKYECDMLSVEFQKRLENLGYPDVAASLYFCNLSGKYVCQADLGQFSRMAQRIAPPMP